MTRFARCPLFNRTPVFWPLSGVKMIAIPDNACVNSSIFCATDTVTASDRYFGENHLVTLSITQTGTSATLFHPASDSDWEFLYLVPFNRRHRLGVPLPCPIQQVTQTG